jgi:hypothetical protein
MAAAQTYEPIATYTATGSISSYTFSSIPGTYTDLRLICSPFSSAGPDDLRIRFNGDTGSNYSSTLLRGSGSAIINAKDNNANYIGWLGYVSSGSGDASLTSVDINNYSNSTTYKTILSRGSLTSGFVNITSGLWRSNSAITSITIIAGAASITVNSTFTLYGIKAA